MKIKTSNVKPTTRQLALLQTISSLISANIVPTSCYGHYTWLGDREIGKGRMDELYRKGLIEDLPGERRTFIKISAKGQVALDQHKST